VANQIDNLTLNDDTTGFNRSVNVASDDLFLSVDLTLQSGGVLTADNIKRGTANPNVALVAGNEGDVYQRTLAGTGEFYVNLDGTTTGWSRVVAVTGTGVQGDILYHNGTDWTRLPAGTSGEFLQTLGGGADPQWIGLGASSGGASTTFKTTSPVSTTSGTYVDALGGSSISPPFDGDYLVIFEGDIKGSTGNTVNQIAIGLNSTTAAAAGTTGRTMQGNGGADIATAIHVKLTGLTTGDTLHGIFRKLSGPGTTTMGDRRITMFKVT